MRGRIETILDAAKARGYRQGENPARWVGHLDQILVLYAGELEPARHADRRVGTGRVMTDKPTERPQWLDLDSLINEIGWPLATLRVIAENEWNDKDPTPLAMALFDTQRNIGLAAPWRR